MKAQQKLHLESDILILSSGSVWTSRETNETLVNLIKQLKEQEIPLNFSINYGTFFVIGGPNGIWSTRQIAGFEKCEKMTNVFTWKGSKEKRNDLEWFVSINYFNSQGNAYSMLPEEPYYEIVWKNHKITQITGGTNDEGFHGCLLDNGQVWVLDNTYYGTLRDEEKFPIANDIGWTHLTFFDDKKVKCVLAMNSIIYVLCENPEQKLYYYSGTHFAERDKREGYPLVPAEDLYFNSKKIFKMVSLPEIVLCWCEEGLYSWLVSNGSSPLEPALSNPVCTHAKKCFPFRFFSSKTILDIAVKKNFYVLCDAEFMHFLLLLLMILMMLIELNDISK